MKIVIAGGTIFKDYNVNNGTMKMDESIFIEFLEDMMLYKNPEVLFWDMRDSLFMKEDDREFLYKFCLNHKGRLLVVHGTDTMSETLEYFNKNPFIGTVVFTGSFYPLCVKGTEAEFNIGFAMACTKILPEGNYLAMNGEVFKENVKKDFKNLMFIDKTNE